MEESEMETVIVMPKKTYKELVPKGNKILVRPNTTSNMLVLQLKNEGRSFHKILTFSG